MSFSIQFLEFILWVLLFVGRVAALLTPLLALVFRSGVQHRDDEQRLQIAQELTG